MQLTEDQFDERLTNALFPGHYGKKPTIRQIISHNIRYSNLSLENTLRTLDAYTRDDEYETLHLFLLGCNFALGNTKQDLLSQLRAEKSFKARLELQQTRSGYEAALALLMTEINELDARRATLNVNKSLVWCSVIKHK